MLNTKFSLTMIAQEYREYLEKIEGINLLSVFCEYMDTDSIHLKIHLGGANITRISISHSMYNNHIKELYRLYEKEQNEERYRPSITSNY